MFICIMHSEFFSNTEVRIFLIKIIFKINILRQYFNPFFSRQIEYNNCYVSTRNFIYARLLHKSYYTNKCTNGVHERNETRTISFSSHNIAVRALLSYLGTVSRDRSSPHSIHIAIKLLHSLVFPPTLPCMSD